MHKLTVVDSLKDRVYIYIYSYLICKDLVRTWHSLLTRYNISAISKLVKVLVALPYILQCCILEG